ncbi:MAG: bifunctional oligoribonuclease/PAP phosphatase NrnA [Candidatus Dormibacteraeota bacterium]|nr:bifunctional oligoribonuclease/PAP phosphatase NrnA [Candidatus Dormibacteraeota bacterium]
MEGLQELFAQVGGLIDAHEEILILGHKDADGDTLGCSLAFAEALRTVGKKVWVIIPPPVPQMYEWLPGYDHIVDRPPAGADPQLVLFFDAGNMERSGSSVRHIAAHAKIVNIDHHMTNAMFGDINVIDPDAAAVGEMVVDMLDAYRYQVTPTIATNLYTAIMTDTGGFRHENTTAHALEYAARLARLGANPGLIASMVYKSRPLTTLKLNALSLAEMQVEAEGRLVWSKVTRQMLKEAGAEMAEAEGIIDNLNSIGGLDLAVLFKEVGERMTKISVRSRGAIDAAALTAEFGGGGHLRAAGAEIGEPMEEAIRLVISAAHNALTMESREAGRPQPR